FGTQEDLLLQYGLPDIDYKLDAKGTPVLTDKSNLDANYVNWKYLEQHSQVMYVPDIPGYAKAEYDAEHVAVPAGVADPTLGFYSPTFGKSNAVLTKQVMDGVSDIIAGNRPISDWDGIVKQWASGGGDQMRKEYLDAMAAAK